MNLEVKSFWLGRNVVSRVVRRARRLRERLLVWAIGFVVRVRFAVHRNRRRHWLPGPLIVSLTSYPPRFGVLPLTLKCLLSQSIAADRTILWIADGDRGLVTEDILSLRDAGLEIRYFDDIGSYKKCIPALTYFPTAFIVTADDDLYYPPEWLEKLVESFDAHAAHDVICHRMHKIRLGDNGLPLPYAQWDYESGEFERSPLSFPTSGAGVLYPPGCFHPDVLDRSVFTVICPSADDVWLYWMLRRNGVRARGFARPKKLISWPGSQDMGLFRENTGSAAGNDRQIEAMIKRYGFPG